MTTIWGLSDLHLAHSLPEKNMGKLFPVWEDYEEKIQRNWNEHVRDDDIVLIPGDISWGGDIMESMSDLEWIHQLPGQKILSKGNHDYWWASQAKMKSILPGSIQTIHNTSVVLHNTIGIIGSKMYNVPGCETWFVNEPDCPSKKIPVISDHDITLFERECERLKRSFTHLTKTTDVSKLNHIIAMIHYPPCPPSMTSTIVTDMLESFGVTHCVFGHLHQLYSLKYTELNGIKYHLVSADYRKFMPLRILDL